MMLADKELLGQYAKGRSESAFAELVRRHLRLVYSAALRQLGGDTHLAEDVCQAVFADLARKAGQLTGRASIAGWLYTSARFAASKTVRSEVRRRNREDAASAVKQETSNVPWAELRDLLDTAMSELAEKDREAIVLRYFEARDLAVVGATLGTTENAARMRVDRALDKLRRVLEKRGVTATGVALAAALAASTADAVPPGLASAVAATAVVTAPAAGGGLLMLAGAAVVAATLAVVVWRQIPSVPPDNTAPPPTIAPTAKTETVSSALELRPPQGDPYQLQKLAQRHDAQVRAHPVATNDWFSQAMKDESGVKKYGARLKATIAPGDTLVGGGWMTVPGTRMLFLITPNLATNGADQVDISSRFIDVPEMVFDSPQLQGFRSADNRDAIVQQMSTDMANRLVNTSNVVVQSAPRMITALGCPGEMSVMGDNPSSNTQDGRVGTSLNFDPSRATDGASINLDFAVCCALPDPLNRAQ
ncbi:MAG TPA: sigma-70 family RNA polymerase sigma factor [Candidatus Saccharimonadales bacterium]|nr:sigma-70 family RNA polymerase sigma factor [Candidatus Saccharimonadales bacterium]